MDRPATVRRRWQANAVVLVDKGDYIIVRPLPADIPSALKGSLPPVSPLSVEQMRAADREAEGSGRDGR